ncbi:hypothetical protein PPL_10413 [Heterostelium album PN500]|uniref:Glycerol kinase 5 n=1 Tax=Heterostelium pallidum (strain ATCC 26659 / Pp 5 / PN500) TaxID=670386 RepID=D3BR10_HETP5|nr:hypothetical protein PPL_10413 [Heterostelium album PN500]EFA76196.1 hypothetical protein PPL_10413 [Heterostelium album PN500]|eukprot:XP_020428329.1 hypothetical protein PPL_10413 [Heterostelium album PN500]
MWLYLKEIRDSSMIMFSFVFFIYYMDPFNNKIGGEEEDHITSTVDNSGRNDNNASSSSNMNMNMNMNINGASSNGNGNTVADLILAIDVGTTNIRAIIFDPLLNIVSKSTQNIPLIIDQNRPGYIEQDPILMWEMCKVVVKDAISLSPAASHPERIRCLGITNQRSTFLTWRRDTGKPIHNLITWQDTRSAEICKNTNNSFAVKGIHGATRFAHLFTGKPRFLQASYLDVTTAHTSSRLAWILENHAEAKKAAKEEQMMFGTIDTWLLWNLTGGKTHATDYSNFSTTGLYDPFEMTYNKVVFYLFNIPYHIMPKICDTSYHYGETLQELFGVAIPITSLCGDQQSAMFGECCFKEGDTKLTIGTGCFVNINTGSQARASRYGMYPLIGWKIGSEITYVMEGKGMAAGTVVDWAQSFGMFESPVDTSDMAASVPHSQGVVFVPALTGLAPPQNDPKARGLIIGLTPSTRKEHVVRALLESFGYRCKELIDSIISDNYCRIKKVVADGGVCQNDFVMQFTSDICNINIDRAAHPEMTAAGVFCEL